MRVGAEWRYPGEKWRLGRSEECSRSEEDSGEFGDIEKSRL